MAASISSSRTVVGLSPLHAALAHVRWPAVLSGPGGLRAGRGAGRPGPSGAGGLVSRIDGGSGNPRAISTRRSNHELSAAREVELQAKLGTPVDHVCLPWGVSGPTTRAALERLGFVSAFANRWSGQYAVRAGDDPFFLKRLNGRHIFALPGKRRRTLVQVR